jgi:hypothetical protein
LTYWALSTLSPRTSNKFRHQYKQLESVSHKLFLKASPKHTVARSADEFYFFPIQVKGLGYDRSFFYLPPDEGVTIETEITKIIDEAVERRLTQREFENVVDAYLSELEKRARK